MQQCMYGTKICDICDLQKCLAKTWVVFEQNIIKAALDQWRDSLRSCMHAGGGHFEQMLWNYYLFVLCGIQNILWNCQCNLVHLMAIL